MRDRKLLRRRSPTRSRSFRRRLEITVYTLAQSTANVVVPGPHEAERLADAGFHTQMDSTKLALASTASQLWDS
jgi:hypothetical protein